MSIHLSTPAGGASNGPSVPPQLNNTWNNGHTSSNRTPNSMASSIPNSNNPAYLMPKSPPKSRRGSSHRYRPTVQTSTGQAPTCIVNASVTYCGNNQIYAFGGFDQDTDEIYNHVLRLDLTTLRWDLVDNYGDIPGVRMGHTASLYQNDKLIVFGGENEHHQYLSDVVVLDLKTHIWTSPVVRGTIPTGRARHSSVIYEDKLYIIGGIPGTTRIILDDLCYLDLKTWTWSRTWSFVPRFDHTSWVSGGRLWVFGGIGNDLERTTDLWWLDLKGSRSFRRNSSSTQGTAGPPRVANRIAHNSGLQYSPQVSSPQVGSYAPNSASIQRTMPAAPGAISSVKFHSAPDVPDLRGGTHFHVYSSGDLLNLATPSIPVQHWDCDLSSLELDSLRWQTLAHGTEIHKPGYRWFYCTVNEDGTKAWLLGCSLDSANPDEDDHLSEVLTIDLEKYGVVGNQASEHNRTLPPEQQSMDQRSSLSNELAAVFDQPPESGGGTDFVITADRDEDECSTSDDSMGSSPNVGQKPPSFLSPDAITSPPIHVHRIILQARWPHFRRLYSAQMIEYHTNKMHIPEPYKVVRAFLYYLYTDSIALREYRPNPFEVAGMLVMANLYDMPKLRTLCVNRLSRELDVNNAAIVWERASRTNEEWLKRRAASFCFSNWGRIVRTDGFRALSKQSLMELCEVVSMGARVITGHELEADRLPRVSTSSALGLDDDLDSDDDDGMELS